MNFSKKNGCPNCEYEESKVIRSMSDFDLFDPLIEKKIYSKITKLLECKKCQSLWIEEKNNHLRHLLYPTAKEIFFKFYDKLNLISEENFKILKKKGTPKKQEDSLFFPTQVITKSGEFIKRAIIILSDSIWPISIDQEIHFISEIESISESSEALTLKQMKALSHIDESFMGSAFLFLERFNEKFMISEETLFIPEEFGTPKEFQILPVQEKPQRIINCDGIVYFYGRLES